MSQRRSEKKSMGPKTAELCALLRELLSLLESAGEVYWLEWMEKSLRVIERRDLAGVEKILEAYGGMGSFSDLFLSASNGSKIPDGSGQEINHRLESIRTKLYELAKYIVHNAEVEGKGCEFTG